MNRKPRTAKQIAAKINSVVEQTIELAAQNDMTLANVIEFALPNWRACIAERLTTLGCDLTAIDPRGTEAGNLYFYAREQQ